jgi:hypothetical protein
LTQKDEGSLRSQASGEVVELRERLRSTLSGWSTGAALAVEAGLADVVLAVVTPELERRDAELITQNRLYRKVGAERDEKQFEVERLRRWVDRFRAALKAPTEGQSEEEADLVETAMRAVEADSAGHWPTVASWLHVEVLRLRGLLATRADPSRDSATSEAIQVQANSKLEQNLEVGSASTPPAAGEADTTPTPRLRGCVERWPDCEEGSYNPSCCRFPKSCSCTIYDPARVTANDLEPVSPSPSQGGGTDE